MASEPAFEFDEFRVRGNLLVGGGGLYKARTIIKYIPLWLDWIRLVFFSVENNVNSLTYL